MLDLLEDKFMRVLLMFDVPTKSKKEQKYATKFRNELIKQGFFMMQFSVYMKICKGISSANSAVERVRGILPPLGNVRALIITEKQFDNMQILLGSAEFNEKMNNDKNLVLFEFDEKIGDYRYFNETGHETIETDKSNKNFEYKTNGNSNYKSNDDINYKSKSKVRESTIKQKRKKIIEQSLFEF